MSQTAVVRPGRPATRPAVRGAGTRSVSRSGTPLRVVGTPVDARSRAGLAIGCLALLGLGLFGLLMLNVSLEKGAYVLRKQQADTGQLMAQRQALQEQLAALEAPQSLEARARQLGMVNAPNVAFVTGGGEVLGVPSPGVAPRAPSVAVQGGADQGGAVASPRPTASGSPRATSSPSASSKSTGKATAKATGTAKVTGTAKATGTPKATGTAKATGATGANRTTKPPGVRP